MPAKYIIRLDDASAFMNYSRWEPFYELFDKYSIRPIIAVIPFNKDPKMTKGPCDDNFWDRVREWQAKDYRIGLHGYEHLYSTHKGGILGFRYASEFAGVPLEKQKAMLAAGSRKFEEEGIRSDIFVAPSHSFDKNTLKAIKAVTGIRYISDGCFLNPVIINGLKWIPQQLWGPRKKSKGVWTICFHPETSDSSIVTQLSLFLNEHHADVLDPMALEFKKLRPTDIMFFFCMRFRMKLRAWRALLREIRAAGKYTRHIEDQGSESMNILCTIDSLSSGGSQRQLVNIAVGFREKGHRVSFLIYHDIRFYDDILRINDIAIHVVQESGYLKRLIRIRRFIRRGGYDAVVSFMETPDFICEIAGLPFRKWKLIVGERSAHPDIYRSVKRIIFRWFHLFSDYVVANSYANLKMVRSVSPLLPRSKCRVVYNMLDLDYWSPLKGYVPLREGRLKLVVVASHQYLKNLNGLVDAIALLSDADREKISVEWYGDKLTEPYYSDAYPQAIEKIEMLKLNDLIRFYPATKEIRQKIQEADAAGLFSFYEGFPNSVCEAMACAKPVICSSVSDLPLLLSDDPALLCDPADARSIARSISYLIGMGPERLKETGERNLAIARKNFDKNILIDSYLNLMN